MLAEGCAFWPAGKPIALRATPQCVNYSVSPIDGIDASPLLGTASVTQEVEVDVVETNGDDAPTREVADQDQREEIGEQYVRHVLRLVGPTFITFTGHATNSYDSVPETVSI